MKEDDISTFTETSCKRFDEIQYFLSIRDFSMCCSSSYKTNIEHFVTQNRSVNRPVTHEMSEKITRPFGQNSDDITLDQTVRVEAEKGLVVVVINICQQKP